MTNTNKNKACTESGRRVFVGLSGGVDSSVTVGILKEQGYQVVGVFMKNWTADVGNFCCSTDQDAMDARLVAERLNIPFYIWNFEEAYQSKVMAYFLAEYEAGRTPNPDVMCNREIKFKLFLERALALGADFVATGHYARIEHDILGYRLLKGVDDNKDQSYFLCTLTQKELSKVLFPIGAMLKPEVRAKAKELNLVTAEKKDSQGLCFVGQIDVRRFLMDKITSQAGAVIDVSGKVLGQHQGLGFYTIGQREGLTMLSNGPWFVVNKDLKNNNLIVSRNGDDPALWLKHASLEQITWTREPLKTDWAGEISVRYRHQPAKGTLRLVEGEWQIEFMEVQRAITPGQWAVFYEVQELRGAGVIKRAW